MRRDNLPLHLKYRPKTFSEFIGNEAVIESLKSVVRRERGRPHAFLFCGASGCGKTTLARILKRELKCGDLDFVELNVADVRGIDTIREIIATGWLKPVSGESRIYVLDEAHKLTPDAQNALLKFLEDTPPHCYVILCTTEPHKLIKTIRTRCSTFQLSPLSDEEIRLLLKRVIRRERATVPDEIVQQIVRLSEGSPRKALVLLDSVIDLDDPEMMKQALKEGADEAEAQVVELCRALLKGEGWDRVRKILQGLKEEDPETVRHMVLGYMNSVLLNSDNPRAAMIIEEFAESFMNSGKAGLTLACYRVTKLNNNDR